MKGIAKQVIHSNWMIVNRATNKEIILFYKIIIIGTI